MLHYLDTLSHCVCVLATEQGAAKLYKDQLELAESVADAMVREAMEFVWEASRMELNMEEEQQQPNAVEEDNPSKTEQRWG